MDFHVASLLANLQQGGGQDAEAREAALQRAAWLDDATDQQLDELAGALIARPPIESEFAGHLLSMALARLGRGAQASGAVTTRLPRNFAQRLAELYRHLRRENHGESRGDCRGRHHLLRVLAERGDEEALASLAELLVRDPPARETSVAEVLTPLFRRRDYDPAAIFPRLLDALAHTSLAASVLDLASYLTRLGRVDRHPAASRRERLEELLGRFAQRLAHLEEHPAEASSAGDAQRTIAESVSLVVSLCHSLALIGDAASIGKLYQALELRHRRIRTEAAAALARLGEEAGAQALIDLAAEPVARLRVLAYAEELGLSDKLPEPFTGEAARAEAELSLWLAQPTQFGLPPSRLELLDRRTQLWPGFDGPVDCFLFRFSYQLGDAAFANIGIAGPLVCSFSADLTTLPVDDLYALFAGWQAEHADIYRLSPENLRGTEQQAAQRLARFLEEAGYSDVRPAWLGMIFGEPALAAEATFEGERGVAVADQDQILWQPSLGRSRPLGVEDVYNLYSGRKLIEAFNA
jgi:hypothetical protein